MNEEMNGIDPNQVQGSFSDCIQFLIHSSPCTIHKSLENTQYYVAWGTHSVVKF